MLHVFTWSCNSRVCCWSDVCVCSLIQTNSLLHHEAVGPRSFRFIRLVGDSSNNLIFPSLLWGRPPFFTLQPRRFGCAFVFQATTEVVFSSGLSRKIKLPQRLIRHPAPLTVFCMCADADVSEPFHFLCQNPSTPSACRQLTEQQGWFSANRLRDYTPEGRMPLFR